LHVIKEFGFTLNLKECKFAQSHFKYVGHIIRCGERKPDPERVATVKDMKVPATKRQVRRLIGFFSYFPDYIKNFAEIASQKLTTTGQQSKKKHLLLFGL